jgi:DNA-binding FrmR family transcriptional regulator
MATKTGPAKGHAISDSDTVREGIHRLEAHLEIVETMITDGASAVELVTGLNSAIALARHAGLLVLEHHVSTCLRDVDANLPAEREDRAHELIEAIKRFTFAVS